LEWDLLAGRTYLPMATLTPVSPIQHGLGGVAGEVAGVVAEVVGSAGAGSHPIGTPGGRAIN